MGKLLSVKDVQNIICCSRGKAYAIFNSNGFPKIQIGKQFYVREEDFDKWLNRNVGKRVIM